ncbi:MAG: hypothetical protein V7L26_02635 [Nostoc sp.]
MFEKFWANIIRYYTNQVHLSCGTLSTGHHKKGAEIKLRSQGLFGS